MVARQYVHSSESKKAPSERQLTKGQATDYLLAVLAGNWRPEIERFVGRRRYRPLLAAASSVLALTSSGPARATYSIVAADRETRELGSSAASCVSESLHDGYGSVVGTGAMVTQAFFHPPALARGLDLIADGKSASEVIDGLTDPSFDVAYERRQHGVVRLAGDFAAFTGAEATPEKGARSGAGSRLIWSVQGNTLTGVDVLDRSEAVMLASDGCDLAETLMRALEAGAEQSGGDARCRPESPAHSAFIQVDRVGEQAGDYLQISVVLSPGDDAVSELRSEFDVWRATHPCPTSADAGTEKPDGHADSGIPADAGDHVDVPESTRDDSQDSDGGCGCRFARARHHRNDGLVVFGLIVGGCAVRSRRSRRPAVSPSA